MHVFFIVQVKQAEESATKIEAELKDLKETLGNIEGARPFDQLTVTDVINARPEIAKTVEEMVKKGKWTLPGYEEKFGSTYNSLRRVLIPRPRHVVNDGAIDVDQYRSTALPNPLCRPFIDGGGVPHRGAASCLRCCDVRRCLSSPTRGSASTPPLLCSRRASGVMATWLCRQRRDRIP